MQEITSFYQTSTQGDKVKLPQRILTVFWVITSRWGTVNEFDGARKKKVKVMILSIGVMAGAGI